MTARSLNLSVVFQPAGTAPGHDSFAMLDQLAQIAQEHSGGNLHIHTQRNRDIWTQVGVLAHAACFVGTSLHGRIVTAAYGRPRVSLENQKVNIYTSTWEEPDLQPFNVPIGDLKASVEKAMSVEPARLLAYANKQAEHALAGFTRLRESLNLFEFTESTKKINEKIKFLTELAHLRECEMLRQAILDLGYELSQEQALKRLNEAQPAVKLLYRKIREFTKAQLGMLISLGPRK